MNDALPRNPALGIGPDGSYTRPGQFFAFVLGLLTTVVFVPLTVLAALLYSWAEPKFATDPGRARVLVIWSWLCLTALPVAVVVLGFGIAMIVTAVTG
ncbi:hypothetical protein [Spirillospora albida]|uniref:hypothetical protein n=1 Tax=Spirillospora albida TaxID=58123 RepID=UPI0004BE88BB|nr:hypothetical protein [Spirillospora albida]